MKYIAFIFALLVFVACSGDDGEAGLPPTTPPVKPVPPTEPEEPEEPVLPSDPTYNVRYAQNVEALNSMTIAAGDMVILADGTYNNKVINIKVNGTADKPIIIKAANEGKVIFTGSSRLMFSGSYTLFEGFWFKDVVLTEKVGIIEFRDASKSVANNCALRKCAISGKNTPLNDMQDYKWVSIYGENNAVENCSFVDKRNIGTLLVVWLTEGSTSAPAHKIKNNYFSRPNAIFKDGSEINGQETIRIGDSGTSMQRAESLVEGNVFYKCNGEMEAISNKSCFNTYRGNLFESCVATLTLRHGTDCVVEDNLFIGNNVAKSGGVRVIDANHRVKGNYMQNLKGQDYRAAICLIRGLPNSAPSGYFPARNCTIADNTIVDCYQGICANYGDSKMTLPVVTTSVANNIITNSTSSNTYVTVSMASSPNDIVPDITWQGNTIYQGKAGTNIPTQGLNIVTSPPPISSRTQQITAIKAAAGVSWSLN